METVDELIKKTKDAVAKADDAIEKRMKILDECNALKA
jgi:uncharacterized coiled-coil DUF342 family protein